MTAVVVAGILAVAPSGLGSSKRTASNCLSLSRTVKTYNTLSPGSSRRGYLILLHTLQRNCPSQTKKLGLTGDYLPKCKRLDQENCTMYAKAAKLP